jgi:hypothetical protein
VVHLEKGQLVDQPAPPEADAAIRAAVGATAIQAEKQA